MDVFGPGWNLTGTLPISCISAPLAACGVVWDGRRFSSCSPTSARNSVPAAEISSAESGRALTVADPLGEVTWITTDGAWLRMAATRTLDVCTLSAPLSLLAVVGVLPSDGRHLQSDPSSAYETWVSVCLTLPTATRMLLYSAVWARGRG